MTAGLDPETLDLVLSSIGTFARERLDDRAVLEFDRSGCVPHDLVRAMCGGELGLQPLFVPEEHGGTGAGAVDLYRVAEVLARVDLGVAMAVLGTVTGIGLLASAGTPAQRRRWLPRIASEGLLVASAVTEPDMGALRTSARLDPAGGYRIRGTKQWISNGGLADVYAVLAAAPGGPSWFLVEGGSSGLSAGRPEDKHGIRAANTAAVHLDDVAVDGECLLGCVEGQGFGQAQRIAGHGRLLVAALALGAGWSALDRTIQYSLERTSAGGTLAHRQSYTHKLVVPHAARLEAARAQIEDAASLVDASHPDATTACAVAKLLASEAANLSADAAMQGHGGYGYTRECLVEKIRRDVRVTTIYEGTSESLEMAIGRDAIRSSGERYRATAAGLDSLAAEHLDSGAATAALAQHGLATVIDRAGGEWLERNQHVLLRLGEAIACAEGAASLARHAACAAEGQLPAKASPALDAAGLAAAARICARDAAGRVADCAVRWLGRPGGGDVRDLYAAVGIPAIHAAQAGLLDDMDRVVEAVYGRAGAG